MQQTHSCQFGAAVYLMPNDRVSVINAPEKWAQGLSCASVTTSSQPHSHDQQGCRAALNLSAAVCSSICKLFVQLTHRHNLGTKGGQGITQQSRLQQLHKPMPLQQHTADEEPIPVLQGIW